ncbi:hypothetical protein L3X38_032288 [Prunus dulcis]|uniref:Uncharacterized protein n=1 Tax=Prunus dulcis TaxID=3755 RepID=A0AAD4VEU6_PRUDU|nr:hypothetical protein L3X38_032288 [Prunus dulcis]
MVLSNSDIVMLSKLVSTFFVKPPYSSNIGPMPSKLSSTLSIACQLPFFTMTPHTSNSFVNNQITLVFTPLGSFHGYDLTIPTSYFLVRNHVFFLVTTQIKVPTYA